jgi:hypothetical protein
VCTGDWEIAAVQEHCEEYRYKMIQHVLFGAMIRKPGKVLHQLFFMSTTKSIYSIGIN